MSFFFPLGFPDLETGWCVCYTHGGGSDPTVSSFFPRSAFRIWKQVRATQGGADPTVSSFFLPLDFWKHTMSFFFNTPRLSGLGNRFVCLYTLLYAGGAIDSTVNFVIDIFFQTFVNGLPDLDTGW